MNVLIPMGGIGARFADKGYRQPKPMVNIVGRPMLFRLLDALVLRPEDTVWLALDAGLNDDFSIEHRVVKEFPGVDFRFVHLTFATRGATETLLTMLQRMGTEHLSRRTISLDCDTLYFEDVLGHFRALDADGCCCYFEDTGNVPRYSYIDLDALGTILDIKEKVRISSHANTGAYGFRTGAALLAHCIASVDRAVGAMGEYYTSSVVADMIAEGARFAGVPISSFACVGTPAELEAFLERVRACEVPLMKNACMRFCFDLDNTLVTYPRTEGDYATVEAKPRMITLVRDLKSAGHYIIIHTARRMKTHRGNVGAVVKDIGLVTLETLSRFGECAEKARLSSLVGVSTLYFSARTLRCSRHPLRRDPLWKAAR